jgi:hypothetical protein
MNRTPRAAVLCLAISGLISFGLPTNSATALIKDGACEGSELCLWMDANAQGCLYDSGYPNPGGEDLRKLRYNTCPSTSLNDNISSYRNGLHDWLVLWEDVGKGTTYCIGPRASGNVLPAFNDKATTMVSVEPASYDPKGCRYIDAD